MPSLRGPAAAWGAIRFPQRVLSLTSAQSSTGNPRLPLPTWQAARVVLRRPPRSRDAYADYSVRLWRTIGGSGYPFDEAAVRRRAAEIFDRGLTGRDTARSIPGVTLMLLAGVGHTLPREVWPQVVDAVRERPGAGDPRHQEVSGEQRANSMICALR